MEKLVLIDGNSLINRAFYAMPLLTTKEGVYTNAVYGFINMFTKMLSDVKPTYVAVAFDVKAPTFRHKMFTDYKGTRKPMPEELRPQIPLLKEVLHLMGIHTVEQAGIEADDIIGTIAKSTDVQTIIYTGDKDSFQLVDERTSVYFTKRGITETEIYSFDNFKEKTGIEPVQIIDLKALMGDASDNIPGVLGIGEKTALSLIQTYSSVDNLYDHIEELTGKLKEKLINGKDSAYLSHTLATINTKTDVDTDIKKMTFSLPFSDAVKQKFIQLEFKSLYKKDELFENQQKPKETVIKESAVIKTIKDGNELDKIRLDGVISLIASYEGVSLYSYNQNTEYQFIIKKTLFDEGLSLSAVLSSILNLLKSISEVIVYNAKDLKHFLLSTINAEFNYNVQDVSLMKYVADFSGGEQTLSDVIEEYNLTDFAPAFALYKIYEELCVKLKEEEQEDLYKKIELPLSDVLFDMENAGFKVDINAINETGKKYTEILSDYERQIRELSGEPNINVNSPKQLGELLFEKLKLGKGKKTKTGYSTNAEVLENLEGTSPIIPLILSYRKIQKLQSTYIEGLKPLIDKNTGLIHTSFNQTVTATGRLSSKEPNLQNIPIREEEGRLLRKFFVPKSKDRILIGADYSQIELRLLAAFSDCKPLIDAFNRGADIHAETASKVFGVKLQDVTPEMRRNAKAVNFGIIYGISEYGLAKNIKTSNLNAKNYINSYFNKYPEVKKYMQENVDSARKNGYAITFMNRRRYIREINSSNYNLRQFGERVAMNMPLQGSAADIIKIAMINVANRLKKEGLKSELILQIHDELIIDAFDCEKEQVTKILKEEMEGAVKLSVPLDVDIGAGKTWFDAK